MTGYLERSDFSDAVKRGAASAGIRMVPGFSSSSILAQARAVANGAGFALLPRYVAAAEPGLVPLLHDEVCVRFPLWLLVHPDVAAHARVRAVADLLVKTFESA